MTTETRLSNFLLLLSLALVPACSQNLFAQNNWTGQVQCQLAIQNSGYTHQEIQTWTITGPSTSAPGSMPVYPASWSVTSQGGTQQLRGTQTLAGQWKANPPGTPTVMAIFVRASDKRLMILPYHTQLRAQGALLGSKQIISPGSAPSQSALPSDVYEWPLPAIQDSASATSLIGTGTITVTGNSLPMQPVATTSTANCQWHFTQGGSAGTSGPSVSTAPLGGVTTGNAVSTPQGLGVSGTPVSGTIATGAGQSGSTSTVQPGSQSQNTTSTPAQSCPSLQGAGATGLNSAMTLGTLSAGLSTTISESLSSQTATKFYRATFAGGADATFTLNAGSDFDLYVYNTSGNSISCSQTRGSNSENLTTRFGNSQSNEVIVEVAAHDWSANGANFTLGVYAANLGSASLPTQANKTLYTTTSGNQTASPSSPSCVDPGGSSTSTTFAAPIVLSYLNAGQSETYSGNLNSATDRRFLQVSVRAGLEANISLNAGSDYDLYFFNSSHVIINCAATHGSNNENIKIQFDSSQTDTTVIIEVAANGWSSGASNFTLGLSAENPVTATQLPSGVQNKNLHTLGIGGGGSSASSPQCTDPGGSPTSSTLGNPIVLGTIGQGQSVSYRGTLASIADRSFYKITLPSGTEANISLTSGSDYDLYLFNSPASITGCSTTRSTGGENYTTHFSNSQSNTVTIEIAAYSWGAEAANFTLIVTGVAPNSSQAITGLTAQPIAVLQNLQFGSQSKQSPSGSGQQSSGQQTSNNGQPQSPGTTGTSSCNAVVHRNGLGQTYQDCLALGTPGTATYSQTMAHEAASAFNGNPGDVSDTSCHGNGSQTVSAVSAAANGACAVWIYTGTTAGHVHLDGTGTCTCPSVSDGSCN